MGLVYVVRYHPDVVPKDLSALDVATRGRVCQAIEQKLMIQSGLYGIPLRQSLEEHRKLREGSYRVIYSISQQYVFVLAILPRSHVYHVAEQRRRQSSP